MSHRFENANDRVLVLAPTGRDAVMIEARLVAAGFECEICEDVEALSAASRTDAGSALIAEEALRADGADALLAALAAQEPWSDLPVLLLTLPAKRGLRAHPTPGLLGRANVMLLQRPMPPYLLLNAVRSAVRARRRQYQMRDLHQQLSRAVQLSDMFMGILGHDLRTPLGAITMAAEVIIRSTEDPRVLRRAGRVLASADRMARMIEQLLDVARVRQGRGIGLHPAAANLFDIAKQVCQELTDAHPQARIEVSALGDPSGSWDADRLAQVVSNLVGNALEHGSPGEPVTVHVDGGQRASLRLCVGNAGEIPEEVIPSLFDPFKRCAPFKAGDKGLGLGLFIAQEIARAHGGQISARVVDGRTIFDVVLPREAQPAETAVMSPT